MYAIRSYYDQSPVKLTLEPEDYASTEPGSPIQLTIRLNDGVTVPLPEKVFTIEITPINNAPTIGFIGGMTMDEDTTVEVPLTINDPDKDNLIVSITSSNTNLIKASGIVLMAGTTQKTLPQSITSAEYAGSIRLKITPVLNANSELLSDSLIRVTVMDTSGLV